MAVHSNTTSLVPQSASGISSQISKAIWLAQNPKEKADFLKDITDQEAFTLEYDWSFWGRPNQFAPAGDWTYWLLLAGRGFGKTRTGAEWVRDLATKGDARRIALVAPTAADIRDVMIEGDSGILSVCPPWNRPKYEPSKRHKLTWPNGVTAYGYSADEPNRFRGPQFHAAWCDEMAAWRYMQDAWDNLEFGVRLGNNPQTCITTTPRPLKLLKEILSDPGTAVTSGSTYDNLENLAKKFIKKIRDKYEGTRLGRQELHAELLNDVPGALWAIAMLDQTRMRQTAVPEDLDRIVVAIDPPVTSGPDADECGIVVAGRKGDQGYVLADVSCQGMSPLEWAKIAVAAYHCTTVGGKKLKADRIIAEVNNGGELVEAVIRQVDANCAYTGVHASRGKVTRAEPIAAMYEQGRIHHVGGFSKLESQMTEFTNDFDATSMGYSPDRVDALVWAFTELFPTSSNAGSIRHGS